VYDVVIVGGGAAGNAAAINIEGEVVLIERKKSIGEPVECAGLVSKRTLETLEISLEESVQNEIYGAYIHSPKGKTVEIGGDKLHAYAIDRTKFDRILSDKAAEKGVRYILNTEVTDIKRTPEGVTVIAKDRETSNKIEVEANLLIGSDGAKSKVREIFFECKPSELLIGAGAEIEDVSIDPKFVHVFFGKSIAPGFFAWIIPTNRKGTKARIGLCTIAPPSRPVKSLFQSLYTYPTTRPYIEDSAIIKTIGGIIPLGYMEETVKNNIMLLGDAASQVKPLSGGGIYMSLLSSKFCSQVANSAIENNRFDEGILKGYHDLWSKEFKKEIMFGMWLRRKFVGMNDNDIEEGFKHLENEEILDVINRYGDIDYPSRLIVPLIKKFPYMLSSLPRLLSLFL